MNIYMKYALELGEKGRYSTRPNPMVGCVIVSDDNIVASGYHKKYGGDHAEINALKQINFDASGMDIYVTLEPCSHQGLTLPCVDAILKAKPRRVIIASLDPNPKVSSVDIMKNAGIEVISKVLEQEAKELNKGFFKRMQTGMPYVTLKLATSIDGKIAMADGESKWITSEASRADVQLLRARAGALISSSNTVLRDNPRLDVRDLAYPSPLKVIMDRKERITSSDTLNIFQKEEVILTKDTPKKVLKMLGERQINDVMIEAGATLSGAFIEAGLVDELVVYQAPKIMGNTTYPMVNIDIDAMKNSYVLALKEVKTIGEDVKLTYAIS